MGGLWWDLARASVTCFELECHANFPLAGRADTHFDQSCNRQITVFVNPNGESFVRLYSGSSCWFCTCGLVRLSLTTFLSQPQLFLVIKFISLWRNLLWIISS